MGEMTTHMLIEDTRLKRRKKTGQKKTVALGDKYNFRGMQEERYR